MASTYGIAEKAADIIKQAHWKPPPPPVVDCCHDYRAGVHRCPRTGY
jgi:hypothetical protein